MNAPSKIETSNTFEAWLDRLADCASEKEALQEFEAGMKNFKDHPEEIAGALVKIICTCPYLKVRREAAEALDQLNLPQDTIQRYRATIVRVIERDHAYELDYKLGDAVLDVTNDLLTEEEAFAALEGYIKGIFSHADPSVVSSLLAIQDESPYPTVKQLAGACIRSLRLTKRKISEITLHYELLNSPSSEQDKNILVQSIKSGYLSENDSGVAQFLLDLLQIDRYKPLWPLIIQRVKEMRELLTPEDWEGVQFMDNLFKPNHDVEYRVQWLMPPN